MGTRLLSGSLFFRKNKEVTIMQKPGVMVYFDLLPALKQMSNAEAGILFKAILEYGRHNIPESVPQLPGKLAVVWPLVQQRLDSDEMRYLQAVTKKRYAAYVRWARRQNVEPKDYVSWQEEKGYTAYDEDLICAEDFFIKNPSI